MFKKFHQYVAGLLHEHEMRMKHEAVQKVAQDIETKLSTASRICREMETNIRLRLVLRRLSS